LTGITVGPANGQQGQSCGMEQHWKGPAPGPPGSSWEGFPSCAGTGDGLSGEAVYSQGLLQTPSLLSHLSTAMCNIESSQNGLGWKGPYRPSSSSPPAMGRDTFHQSRLLISPVQPGLEHTKGGGSHSFSGQPGPGPSPPSE